MRECNDNAAEVIELSDDQLETVSGGDDTTTFVNLMSNILRMIADTQSKIIGNIR